MPEFIVDRFDGGDAKVITIGYDELPRGEVIEMARLGDAAAQVWLDEHPIERPR